MHHHDALRATFKNTPQGWVQQYQPPSEHVPLKTITTSIEGSPQDAARFITTEANFAQRTFSLTAGPLLQVIYYDLQTATGPERRLLIICHHLIIDGVSWRILLSDLQMLYQKAATQAQSDGLVLPPKTIVCSQWTRQLAGTDFTSELDYWENIAVAKVPPIPQDFVEGHNLMGTAKNGLYIPLASRNTKN